VAWLSPSWRLLGGILLVMTLGANASSASHRTLYAYAPTASDPALLRQRSLLAPAHASMVERDLILTEIIGKRPHFEAVLVGKDGGEKFHSSVPLTPDRLFEIIDALPMRREEMHQR
jgi:hypothetical protein